MREFIKSFLVISKNILLSFFLLIVLIYFSITFFDKYAIFTLKMDIKHSLQHVKYLNNKHDYFSNVQERYYDDYLTESPSIEEKLKIIHVEKELENEKIQSLKAKLDTLEKK